MSGIPILFGGFNVNDSINYFVTLKPMSTVQIQQSLINYARTEGVKKSGEAVRARTIQMTVKVVGISRNDLEAKVDALYQALNKKQQQLIMRSADNRYYIADAVYQEALLGVGNVIDTDVKVTFTCQQPYANAPSSSSYDTGIVTLGQVGTLWQFPSIVIPGGGTVFSHPTITLTNQRGVSATSLTTALTSGTYYTSLNVVALVHPMYANDALTLQEISIPPLSGLPTQQITLSADAHIGDTVLYVDSFSANANYNISGQYRTEVFVDTNWTEAIIQQTNNNQYFSVSGSNLVPNQGNTLTVYGDPINGWFVVDSSNPGVYLAFVGTPPTLLDVSTSFVVSIAAPSAVVAECAFSWTSRYLS